LAYGYFSTERRCLSKGPPCAEEGDGRSLRSVNVSLARTVPEKGAVCLELGKELDPENAVVVVAPTGGPIEEPHVFAVDHAEWIPSAPNCAVGQIEIDTYYDESTGSSEELVPTLLPFSFAIY